MQGNIYIFPQCCYFPLSVHLMHVNLSVFCPWHVSWWC